MSNDIPVQEIGELLDEITGKIPKLISGLMDTFYSADAGKKIGQSVGSFYTELVASGIPQDEAIKMAKDYMLTLKDMASTISNNTGFTKNNVD